MGQSISKRFVVPKLTDAMKSYESIVAKEAMDDIAARQAIAKAKGQKYIDPSAQFGFKRDTWKDDEGFVKEVHQRDFLKSQQPPGASGSGDANNDIPKDLIDFLNDVGPLDRKVSKEFTSEKVYDSLVEEEDAQRQQLREEARQRKRRRMPMVENMQHAAGSTEEERMMAVERTTNFSTAVKEEEDDYELSFSDEELFDLVWKLQNNETTIEQYLLEEKNMDIENSHEEADDNGARQKQIKANIKLLENLKQHSGIPILMQDADRALIGAPVKNVESLKFENVRMAPDHIQLSYMAKSIEEEVRNKELKSATVVK